MGSRGGGQQRGIPHIDVEDCDPGAWVVIGPELIADCGHRGGEAVEVTEAVREQRLRLVAGPGVIANAVMSRRPAHHERRVQFAREHRLWGNHAHARTAAAGCGRAIFKRDIRHIGRYWRHMGRHMFLRAVRSTAGHRMVGGDHNAPCMHG